MAGKNSNLHSAKKEKNDEFYTLLSDIEKELKHYKHHFKDKVVLCNCDDPDWSNFFVYFSKNFVSLGLKKLISTHYSIDGKGHKLVIENKPGTPITMAPVKTELKGAGDFRGDECIEILKEADIVVTNPPFSLFREYVAQLIEYDKKFLIVGNMNALSYKEIFPLIKDNKVWLGYNSVSQFQQVDGSIKKFGNILWYTNLEIDKRHEELILYKDYDENLYPKYDNYDAINVDKVKDIPKDYYGCVGVPITFLDKYCVEQFEIVGAMTTTKVDGYNYGYPYIKGKKQYARILIRRKK